MEERSETPKRPDKLPDFVKAVGDDHPEVWEAYNRLGDAVSRSGPMDKRTLRLVKLGIAIGARSEGAVHSHARRGLGEGIPPEELEQVALLAITTLGWSQAMAGYSWIQDVTRKKAAE
jgi:alkylhydroperoxidase/carboxymuconolactone decarboxylase family protein YurZ